MRIRTVAVPVLGMVAALLFVNGASHGADSNGEYSTGEATISASEVNPATWAASQAKAMHNKPLAKAAADASGEYTTSTAVVVYYNPTTGKTEARKRFGANTAGKRLGRGVLHRLSAPRDHGTAGTSSASGCARVTVTQTRHNTLGSTAWKFDVWTDWCWTRSTQVDSVNDYHWKIYDVDGQHQWDKIINQEHYYYDFSTDDGHPKSAYYNYYQGHLTNCVLKVGCIQDEYPANYLRTYYNGTYVWDTSS
jgi:hypothetical protein